MAFSGRCGLRTRYAEKNFETPSIYFMVTGHFSDSLQDSEPSTTQNDLVYMSQRWKPSIISSGVTSERSPNLVVGDRHVFVYRSRENRRRWWREFGSWQDFSFARGRKLPCSRRYVWKNQTRLWLNSASRWLLHRSLETHECLPSCCKGVRLSNADGFAAVKHARVLSVNDEEWKESWTGNVGVCAGPDVFPARPVHESLSVGTPLIERIIQIRRCSISSRRCLATKQREERALNNGSPARSVIWIQRNRICCTPSWWCQCARKGHFCWYCFKKNFQIAISWWNARAHIFSTVRLWWWPT